MDLSNQVILAALVGAAAALLGGLLQSVTSYLILRESLKGQRKQTLRHSHISVGAEFLEEAFHGIGALRVNDLQLDHRDAVFLGERLKLVVAADLAARVEEWTSAYVEVALDRPNVAGRDVDELEQSLQGLQEELRRSITGEN